MLEECLVNPLNLKGTIGDLRGEQNRIDARQTKHDRIGVHQKERKTKL
jgi:hypothetical protein